MSIDVLCTECSAKLRVPDEAAGAQAKCPHCNAVFDIDANLVNQAPAAAPPTPDDQPMAPQPPSGDGHPPQTPGEVPQTPPPPNQFSAGAQDDVNPYAAPPSSGQPEAGYPLASTQFGQLDAGMTLQIAWEMFRANMPLLVTTHGTFLLIAVILSALSNAAEQNGSPGLSGMIDLVSVGLQWFMTIGTILITVGLARGRHVEYGELFAGGPWFLRFAVANILYGLMVGFGLLLLIVPGVYLAVKYWPVGYFVVDRNMQIMDAFKAAGDYTEGNKLQSILLWFLSFLVGLGGILLFCLGFVLAYPIITLMWSLAYLMITRQAIQRPQV